MPALHSTTAPEPEGPHPDHALLAAGALLDTLIERWVPLALRDEQLSREVARLAHSEGWATITPKGELQSYLPGGLHHIGKLEERLGAMEAAEAELHASISIDRLATFIRTLLPSTPAGLAVHARALRWSFERTFYLRPPPPDGEDDALIFDFLATVERIVRGWQ
ncbi:hypothetical protein RUR49_19035 [Pseudoxanthobacter sp. M-2]|uniref:hypothetical protein n=1 Tax=Pseudoxanthobacter sp. M-2 TaxID=3078754 RepID=UPI0038FD2545